MKTKTYGKRLTTILLSVSLLLSSTGISLTAFADGSVSTDTVDSDIVNDVPSDASSDDAFADTDIGIEGGALSLHLADVVVEGGEIIIDDDKSGGSFGGGNGSVSSPYLIEDAGDLMAMQSIINSSANANKYFKLSNDIDLSPLTLSDFSDNHGFYSLISLSPSSSDPNVFFELDGDGYEISGLDITVDDTDDIDAIAIFGYINASSVISKVTFSDCTVNIGNKSVAAAAVVAVQNFGTITNCIFTNLTVDLTSTVSDSTNGLFTDESILLSSHTVYSGISAVAADNKGTITSSQASGITIKLINDRRYVGAIAGQNRYVISDITENTVVIHSYGSYESSGTTSGFTEVPTGNGDVSKYVGSIAGYNRKAAGISSPTPVITGCSVNITDISTVNLASGDYVGGICGYNAGEITDCIITGSFANSGDAPGVDNADMSGYGRFGGIAGANEGSVESSTAYNIGMYFTDEDDDSAFGGIAGENSGSVNGCVSSGYADDNGNGDVGIGGIAGSVLNGSSLVNCYAFVKLSGFTNNGGAVIGKNGTAAAVSTCRWSSVASGTVYPCPGDGAGLNDLMRTVNVLNIADGVDVTVPKSSMTHSWSGTGVATVSVSTSPNNAVFTGSGITVSDSAGTSFTVSSSTIGASGVIKYTANVAFPSGVGASGASMALVLSLPVLVTDTTTTNMSASPKIFAGTTRAYPIVVSTYGQLRFMETAPDAHFMLGSNITVESGWSAFDFRGTLDGDGYTISTLYGLFTSVTGSRNSSISTFGWETDSANLSRGYIHDLIINLSDDVTGSMFGNISDATLMNITYGGSGAVTLSSSDTGALVSTLGGNCYMYKCYVSVPVNITAASDTGGIGALVGKVDATNFIIDNCGSSSAITLSNDLSGVAGLIGNVSSLSGNGTVSNCYATGKVRVSGISGTPSSKVVIGTIASAVHDNPNFEVVNVQYSVAETSDSGYKIAQSASNYTTGISLWKLDATYYQVNVNGGTNNVTVTMPSNIEAWSSIADTDFNITFADAGILTAGSKSVSGGDFSFVVTSTTGSAFSTVMTVTHIPSGLKARVTVRSGLSENSEGYIEIHSPQDLVAFSNGYGTTYGYDSNVMLCADIDMDDGVTDYNALITTRLASQWNMAFTGEFVGKLGANGEKFAIRNLHVSNNSSAILPVNTVTTPNNNSVACGFFSYATNATFRDFSMIDCTVENVGNGTGILVGCCDLNSNTGCTFENIDIIGGYAEGSAAGTGGVGGVTFGLAGSLIGAIRSSATSGNPYTIKDIYVKDVTVGFSDASIVRSSSAGGLIGGCAYMTADLTIGEDVSKDDISEPSIVIDNVNVSGYQYIGGVIGSVLGNQITPLNQLTSAAVTGSALVGARLVVNGVEIKGTTIEGIEGTTPGGTGGIIGASCANSATSVIKNCTVDSTDISGAGTNLNSATSCSGGIAGVFGGYITNCTVKDSNITGLISGGIVARAVRLYSAQQVTVQGCNVLGDTVIQRCAVTNPAQNQNSKAGGIVGAVANTEITVENCGVGKGVRVEISFHTGGIIGDATYNNDITGLYVNDCVSYAMVQNDFSTILNDASAGGIIGYVNAPANDIAITAGNPVIDGCFVGGEVNNVKNASFTQHAGGIVGYYYYNSSIVNTSPNNELISDCTVVAQINNYSSSYTPGNGGKIIGHVYPNAEVLKGTSATYTVSGVVLSSFCLPDDHSVDSSQSKAAYGDAAVDSDSGAMATYVDINRPGGYPLYAPDGDVVIDATPDGNGVVHTTAQIILYNELTFPTYPGYVGYDENARLVFNTDTKMTEYGNKVSGWRSLDNDAIEINSATPGTASTKTVINITGYENTNSGIYGAYEAQGLYVPGTDELASIYVCIEVECINFLDFNLSGSGTPSDPFIIMTKKDLDSLRDAEATAGVYTSYYYELGADIVFSPNDFVAGGSFYNSGKLFEPIGYDSSSPSNITVFTGHLSGKRTSTGVQHYIRGLKINTASTHCGLFAKTDGAVFTDLYFIDTAVTSTGNAGIPTNYYTGALAGYAGDTTFSNITFDNTRITATASTTFVNGYAGTLAGYVIDSAVEGCSIIGSTISSASYIGGVFGHAHQSTSVASNVISDTVVTGLNAESSDLGTLTILDIAAGVAGEFSGTIDGVTVSGTGEINGSRASGVVGLLDETGYNHLNILDTSVNGVISIVSESTKSNTAAAGIVAKIKTSQQIIPTSEALLIDGCTVSNKVSITAQYYVGGLVGSCQSLSGAATEASIIITDSSSFASVTAEDSLNGVSAYMQGAASAVISYVYTGTVLQISGVTAGGTIRAAKYAGGIIAVLSDGSLQYYSDTLISNCVISAKIGYTAESRQPAGCCLGLAIAYVTTSVLPTGVSYAKNQFVNLYYSSFQNDSVPFTGNSTINSSAAPDFDTTLCDIQEKVYYFASTGTPTKITLSSDPITLSSSNIEVGQLNGVSIGAGESFAGFTAPNSVSFDLTSITSRDNSGSSNNLFSYNTITKVMTPGDIGSGYAVLRYGNGIEVGIEISVSSGGGSGTEADPYIIDSIPDLEMIRINENDDRSCYYVIAADLDFTGYNIGDPEFEYEFIPEFTGHLSGHYMGIYYSISNLIINNTETSNTGFFGTITAGAGVEDLAFENFTVTGVGNVGVLAGSSAGSVKNITISGCDVSDGYFIPGNSYTAGDVVCYYSSQNDYLYYVCRQSYTYNPANPSVYLPDAGSGAYWAEIEEWSDSESYSSGDYCLYDGKIYLASDDIAAAASFQTSSWSAVTVATNVSNVGGVVGSTTYAMDGCTVNGLTDDASKITGGLNVGGIAGLSTVAITNCIVSDGTVIKAADLYLGNAGGIVGKTGSSVSNCVVEHADITSGYYAGGIAGLANTISANMTFVSCTIGDSNAGETVSIRANWFAGGIIGTARGNSSNMMHLYITDCLVYSDADITSTNGSAAGILSQLGQNMNYVVITGCESYADVTATLAPDGSTQADKNAAAGILAYTPATQVNVRRLTIQNCVGSGSLSAFSCVGGIIGNLPINPDEGNKKRTGTGETKLISDCIVSASIHTWSGSNTGVGILMGYVNKGIVRDGTPFTFAFDNIYYTSYVTTLKYDGIDIKPFGKSEAQLPYEGLTIYDVAVNGSTGSFTVNNNQWFAGEGYDAGEVILNDGVYYVCVVPHTSGSSFTSDASNWISADAWVPGTSYAAGSICLYGDTVYSALTAHISATPPSGDEENWSLVSVVKNDYLWVPENSYKSGEIAYYDGSFYVSNSDHTSGEVFTDDVSSWTEVSEWAPSTSYDENSYCAYDYAVYQAVSSHTSSSAFEDDSENWSKKTAVAFGYSYTALVQPYSDAATADNTFKRSVSVVFTSQSGTNDMALSTVPDITVFTDGGAHVRKINIDDVYVTNSSFYSDELSEFGGRKTSVLEAVENDEICPECDLIVDLGYGLIVGMPVSAYKTGLVSNGRYETPYVIKDETDFVNYFFGPYATGAYLSNFYYQDADLDFSEITNKISQLGKTFKPIGENENTPFTGGYDGGGHRIIGFSYNGGSSDYCGLFGYVSDRALGPADSMLKNIHIELVAGGVSGDECVGGLAGYYSANCVIENCSVVYSTVSGSDRVGGLVGYMKDGALTGCFSSCEVKTTGFTSPDSALKSAGGLIGFYDYTSTDGIILIKQSFSSSDVLANYYASGLVGKVAFTSAVNQHYGKVYLADCYFTGSVCAYSLFNFTSGSQPVSILVGHLEVYKSSKSKANSVGNEYVLAQDVYVAGTNVARYYGEGDDTSYYPVLIGTSQEISSGTVDGVSYASRNIYYDASVLGTISVDTNANTTLDPDVIIADTGVFTDNIRGDGFDNPKGGVGDTKIVWSKTPGLTSGEQKFASTLWDYSDTKSYPILEMLDDYSDAFSKVSAMPLFVDEREEIDADNTDECGTVYSTYISNKTPHEGNPNVTVSSSVFWEGEDTVAYNGDYDINLYGNRVNGNPTKDTDLLFRDYEDKKEILRNCYFTKGGSPSRDKLTPYVTISAVVDGYAVSRKIRLTFRADINKYYISTERQLRAIMNSQSGGTESTGKFSVYQPARNSTSEVFLCADIELNGSVLFTPISGFEGHFKGQGCTVRNLNITGETNVGFFTSISSTGKNICGITFENVKITGSRYVGTLIGRLEGAAFINDCVVDTVRTEEFEPNDLNGAPKGEGNYTSNAAYIPASECIVSGNFDVGGLIGTMNLGSVGSPSPDYTNVSNQASGADVKVEGQRCVGGFVGSIVPNTFSQVQIKNCFARGDVSSKGEVNTNNPAGAYYYSFGGFVGTAKKATTGDTGSSIDYAFATGDVTVEFGNVTRPEQNNYGGVGGFCGVTEVNTGKCFSSGAVEVEIGEILQQGTNRFHIGVGGLVGYAIGSTGAVISNSYSSSSVSFTYGSESYDDSGFTLVGVGGVCGITQFNVTKVYSSGSILMSHLNEFQRMFYGGAIGYASGGTISKTYYDTWTNNIMNLYALGGNPSDQNMQNGGITDTGDVCGITTDDFCDETRDNYVIDNSKLPSEDWGSNNNAYPYLKEMFNSEVSDYIKYPSVLSIIAVRPNERDTAARTENRGYSMALTMPDTIVIVDKDGHVVEYSISWNVPDTEDAVGVINSGGNIYAPVRTSNDAQYLSLIAWVTSYEEIEDYNGDGITEYDNNDATDGYRKYAERNVDKLYQRMDGTEEYPYLISSVLDLEYIYFEDESGWLDNMNFRNQWFSPIAGGVNVAGKVHFKLITNIDMTQDVYLDGDKPVIGEPGSREYPCLTGDDIINSMAGNVYYPDLNDTSASIEFAGISIDGNDYVIRNYSSAVPFITTLDSSSELKNILFVDATFENSGTGDCAVVGTNNGTIDGLIVYDNGSVENVISASDGNAAAVAAVNNGIIKNCVSNTNVEAEGTGVYAGGIAAVNNGTIIRSTSAGTVIAGAGAAAAGGIAGINNENKSVTSSFSSGVVIGNSSSITGGLVGINEGTVTSASSRTKVAGYYDTSDSVNLTGSLVGRNEGVVSDSFAAGFTTIYDIPEQAQGSALVGSGNGTVTNSFADKALLGSSGHMLLGDSILTEDLFDASLDGFTSSGNNAYPQITDIINLSESQGDYELLKRRLLKAYSQLCSVTVDSEYAQYIDTLTEGANNTVTALDSDDYVITTGSGPALTDVNGAAITGGSGTISATVKEVTVSGELVSPIRTKVTAGDVNVADEIGFYPELTFDFACGEQNPSFAGGNGTEAAPYQIDDRYAFESLAYFGAAPEAFFVMAGDVSFGGSEPYEPISLLAGSLNGNSRTVSDVVITNNNALIGEITGTLSNLGLVGITLTATGEDGANYGLLAAKATGAEISGSYAVGSLTVNQSGTAASANVGGLVGYMNTSQIQNCVSSGKIINKCTGSDSTTGGIAGLVSGGAISDSESTAYVYGLVTVGGIAGRAGSSSSIANVIFAGTVADSGLLTVIAGAPGKTATADVSNILGQNDSCTVTNAYYDRQTSLLSDETTYTGASTFDLIKLKGMTAAFTSGNGWITDENITAKKYYPSPIAKTGSEKFKTGLNFATVRVTVSLAGNEGSVYCYDNINVPTPVNAANDTVTLSENRNGFSNGNYYLAPSGTGDSMAPGTYFADFTSVDISLNTAAGSTFAGNSTAILRYIPVWIVKSILVEYEVVSAAGSGFDNDENFSLLVSPTTDGFGVAANALTSVDKSTGANGEVRAVYQKMVLVEDNGREGIYVSSILPEGFDIDGIEWYPGTSTGNTENAVRSDGSYFLDLAEITDDSIHMTVTIGKEPVKWGVNRVWNSITATLN